MFWSTENIVEVITVYVGDDQKTNNKLLKMLDKIFSSKYNVDEKKRFLQDECGVEMTEEVEEMCNYSDYVRAEGMAEGKVQEKLDTAKRMKADGMPVVDIIKYTGLTIQQIETI